MRREDFEAELNTKKEIGIKDFKLLSEYGQIGLYEECELTHIYLLGKENKLYHYFAIISFEEFTEPEQGYREKSITEKLTPINKDFKLGISQKRISILESKHIFDMLCQGSYTFHNTTFIMPEEMQLLPKSHIPTNWDYSGPMINKVLKPNLWGDKYILEFTALENPFKLIFKNEELNKINSKVKELLPIDLGAIYDRIGSYIFQFPITIIDANCRITKDWTSAKLSLTLNSIFQEETNLLSNVTTKLDNVVTGHHSILGSYIEKELEIGDSNNLEFKVFNISNGIIYEHSRVNFIREIGFNMRIGMQNSEPRTIIDNFGNIHEISLSSYEIGSRSRNKNSYDSRTKQRIIQNDIINKSGRFLSVRKGEREKALSFVKNQIREQSGNCSEIWLWDPFLDYRDILNTLYHSTNSGIKFKCITSYKKYKDKLGEKGDYRSTKLFKLFLVSIFKKRNENNNYRVFKNEMKEGLLNYSNNLSVNLDFRAVHGNFGFDFHDRFLFFIPKDPDKLPSVFSLGTSVNGLGNSHHLIQQTLDPRNIIETFDELWKLLENDESKIIKLPEALNDR
jgi:hypothetical protein